MTKPTSTKIRLSSGTFTVTAQYIGAEEHEHIPAASFFRVTVSDGDVALADDYSYVFNEVGKLKKRLGVRDLGRAFMWTLIRAKQATMSFDEFLDSRCPDLNVKKDRGMFLKEQQNYRYFQRLLAGLALMGVTASDLPAMIKEVTAKYELHGRR